MLKSTAAPNGNHWILHLGDLPLAGGGVLANAKLAFQTYGLLNDARDNCIVFPTYYTGTHESNARMIGPGRALDPARWFIVVPNLFGNGLSSSPSNTPGAQRGADFPRVTILDNVRAQHRLVVEHLGVARIALATGWSMGAVQAYQWAASYPELVARLLPFCGAARCSPHNAVFIAGVTAALKADPTFAGGRYTTTPVAGLKAFGRVYAGWAYSQAFFRDALYRNLGHSSLEEFLIAWEDEHLVWDANDLLAKFQTWLSADVSADPHYAGDFERALGAIKAKTIVMPGDRDLYFTLDDNRHEAALIPGAELRAFRSDYGHCAGAPGRFPEEMVFLETALRELLAR
ncbi:MAG: alpha/beta fold hydrolase [Gammaproteobacteria bacterium]|nr:alpha/beta fold hydrolase [Gammaproteobacteria bacterium]